MADELEAADDEDAYDMTTLKKRPAEVPAMPAATKTEAEGPPPDWAKKWKKEQRKSAKLSGTCAAWNKGFGFIAREGFPDVYCHQRDIKKTGFRSLLVGEAVEYRLSTMADGKVQAVDVTGPDGEEVIGTSKPSRDSDDEAGADEAGGSTSAGGPVRKADEPKPAPAKPYTSFVPRNVRKPAGVKPKPKPKPAAAPPVAAAAASAAAPSGEATAAAAATAAPAAPAAAGADALAAAQAALAARLAASSAALAAAAAKGGGGGAPP